MAKIHKEKILQNLHKYRVYIEDTEPSSRYFQLRDAPDVLHAGKNAIVIAGSENLVDDTEVYVEILDVNGDTIFSQPIRNYAEGRARIVSVEVYEDTPPGPGLLTILGHLATTADGQPIPDQWKSIYNVRWQKRITIDPGAKNTSKIRLYTKPTLDVSELLFNYRKSITGSVESANPVSGSWAEIGLAKYRPDDSLIKMHGNPPTYLSQSFISGTFTVSTSSFDCSRSASYTGTISEVINSTTMYVTPAIRNDSGSLCLGTTPGFKILYPEQTEFTTTTLTRSFADCSINNLRTFTGKVARAKIFFRSVDEAEFGYEYLADQIIQPPDLTVTQSVIFGPNVDMGTFVSQSIIDAFWISGDILTNSNGRVANPAYTASQNYILTHNTDRLIDSLHISNLGLEDTGSSYPLVYFGLTDPLDFLEGSEYELKLNYLCRKDRTTTAKMEVYLTGSSFANITNPLGALIATYEIPPEEATLSSGYVNSLRMGNSSVFISPKSGSAYLNFVVYGGDWYINNVDLDCAIERGFNSDYSTFLVSMTGRTRRYEQLQFKAQLFDPDNNEYPESIESDVVFFDGGNLLLRGPDHRLEGKFTVSPSGSGATLSSEGFEIPPNPDDIDKHWYPGGHEPGTAIYIGEGTWFDKRTPFLVAASDVPVNPIEWDYPDPKISFANKLRGYMLYSGVRSDGSQIFPNDPEFVLEIYGTLLIGSGSDLKDYRYFYPRASTDSWFHRIRGINLEFWDLQGRKAFTAGEIDAQNPTAFRNSPQIARMGKYTRGSTGRIVPPEVPLILPGITSSINPFSATSVTESLASSGTINVPSNLMIYNNTLYGNMEIGLNEELLSVVGNDAYTIYAELIADTSWIGYESGSRPGSTYDPDFGGSRNRQTIAVNNSIWVTQAGNYSPAIFLNYPIHIPEDRPSGAETLYIVIRLIITTTTNPSEVIIPNPDDPVEPEPPPTGSENPEPGDPDCNAYLYQVSYDVGTDAGYPCSFGKCVRGVQWTVTGVDDTSITGPFKIRVDRSVGGGTFYNALDGAPIDRDCHTLDQCGDNPVSGGSIGDGQGCFCDPGCQDLSTLVKFRVRLETWGGDLACNDPENSNTTVDFNCVAI